MSGLLGNLILFSYFAAKREWGATAVQAVGVASTSVLLAQVRGCSRIMMGRTHKREREREREREWKQGCCEDLCGNRPGLCQFRFRIANTACLGPKFSPDSAGLSSAQNRLHNCFSSTLTLPEAG
jgi:hypothetical protein